MSDDSTGIPGLRRPINPTETEQALYALVYAVYQAPERSDSVRAALERAHRALSAAAEGWPHAVRVKVMDRPGRWAHIIVHGQYQGGFLVEVERYEDAEPDPLAGPAAPGLRPGAGGDDAR